MENAVRIQDTRTNAIPVVSLNSRSFIGVSLTRHEPVHGTAEPDRGNERKSRARINAPRHGHNNAPRHPDAVQILRDAAEYIVHISLRYGGAFSLYRRFLLRVGAILFFVEKVSERDFETLD